MDPVIHVTSSYIIAAMNNNCSVHNKDVAYIVDIVSALADSVINYITKNVKTSFIARIIVQT